MFQTVYKTSQILYGFACFALIKYNIVKMELDSDFIAIQGVFINLQSVLGDLKLVKDPIAHKKQILKVVTEVQKFFVGKKYIVNEKVNVQFAEQVNKIVLFLILNTHIESDLEQEHLASLINIIPQLSKLLLCSIVLALDLAQNFRKALEPLSLHVVEELLVEMVEGVKRLKPRLHLEHASQYLHLIVFKLNQEMKKNLDIVEKLNSLASAMLLNLTVIAADQKRTVPISEIYVHIGNTIDKVLDLLLECDTTNPTLLFLMEKLIHTCYGLMMTVTMNIFCEWAEIDIENETLQSTIATKAYYTIEKYNKFHMAKDLIQIFSNMARKPKTVKDVIYQASYDTIISMINKADANQAEWFRAIINPQTLTNDNMMDCVDKWAYLCTKDDVLCLLTQCNLIKNQKAVNLVVKCATTLELDDLNLVLIRHFYNNGINSHLSDNIHAQLTILFNKLKDKQVDEYMSKDLHLLLLQNPEQFLRYLLGECLKNSFYTTNLRPFLAMLQQILLVQKIGCRLLQEEMRKQPPDESSLKHVIILFNTLVSLDIYSTQKVILDIVSPFLREYHKNREFKRLKQFLEIIDNLKEVMGLRKETEEFFTLLFELMEMYRCKFLEFNRLHYEITSDCVKIVEKYCKANENSVYYSPEISFESNDTFVSYYIQKLLQRTESLPTFLQHLLPNVRFNNDYEVVAHLIKVLPLCTMQEWIELGSNLIIIYGCLSSIESFSNCLLLLSQVINTQANETAEVQCMLSGLKCCLQNYGNLIKDLIRARITNNAEDVVLTKNVCKVLQQIPSVLKQEEGLSLANLLSDASLRSLRDDKKFAALVASIEEPIICKMLAEKILQM